MKVNQYDLEPKNAEKLSFWSRVFAGAMVIFVLLVALGRLSEAILFSFEADPPQVLFHALRLTSALALFVGGATSTRLAPGNQARPFLNGFIVWGVTAIILLQLAAGGIEIYGSSTMFGEITDDGDLPLTDYAASWGSLLGIVLSVLTCIVGAWLGSVSARRHQPIKRHQWQERRLSLWRFPLQGEGHAQALH